MVEKLKVKAIYDDFLSNVSLTSEQKKILDMLINREKTIKIALEMGMSQRTVGYEIKKIKKLYKDYYDLQLYKVILLIK